MYFLASAVYYEEGNYKKALKYLDKAIGVATNVGMKQLVNDYICWLAPWLLLLPTLDTATRQACEENARIQPLTIAQQYRLYPAIIDQRPAGGATVRPGATDGVVPQAACRYQWSTIMDS